MIYAFDTNAASDAIAGRGRVGVRLQEVRRTDLGLPRFVAFELLRGASLRDLGQVRTAEIEAFILSFGPIEFDADAVRHAAHIDADLIRRGQRIGPLDTLIAGTVRARGLILVTRNLREFGRIDGLATEDWY